MKNNEKGFSVVEVLLVIVIISLVGFAGWYVWNKRSDSLNQSNSTNNSPNQQLEAYKRTTTVPEDWKTFTSDKYKFSISYPTDWQVDESSGTLSEGSTATNKDFFSLGFRPYSTGPMAIQYQFNVSHETLEQAVTERKRIFSENQSPDEGGVKQTITNEKRFTYDGHKAIRLDMTSDDGAAPDSYASEIYISANGLLYKFDTSFHDKNALQDEDVLSVFESLKIN